MEVIGVGVGEAIEEQPDRFGVDAGGVIAVLAFLVFHRPGGFDEVADVGDGDLITANGFDELRRVLGERFVAEAGPGIV